MSGGAAGRGGKTPPPLPDELRPLIGVSVVLRRSEEFACATAKHDGNSLVKNTEKHAASQSPVHMEVAAAAAGGGEAAGLDRSFGDIKLQERREVAATPPPLPAAAMEGKKHTMEMFHSY